MKGVLSLVICRTPDTGSVFMKPWNCNYCPVNLPISGHDQPMWTTINQAFQESLHVSSCCNGSNGTAFIATAIGANFDRGLSHGVRWLMTTISTITTTKSWHDELGIGLPVSRFHQYCSWWPMIHKNTSCSSGKSTTRGVPHLLEHIGDEPHDYDSIPYAPRSWAGETFVYQLRW